MSTFCSSSAAAVVFACSSGFRPSSSHVQSWLLLHPEPLPSACLREARPLSTLAMATSVPSPLHSEPSDVAEYAHEESPSINRHAPAASTHQPPPHTAILIPSTPEPLDAHASAQQIVTPPNPTYHLTAGIPAPAKPIPHPSFLATPIRQPCPVEWKPRSQKAAPRTPSTSTFDPLTMSQRVHNVDMGQQQHYRRVLTVCAATILLTLLLIVAFAAAVYYLAEGRDPRLSDGAVLSGMLVNGSVTTDKLAAGAVTNGTLSAMLYAALLTLNKSYTSSLEWMPTAGAGLWRSQWNPAVLNVNVNGSALAIVNNSVTISAGAVHSQHIANSSVTAAAIAPAAVSSAALQPSSVTINSLAANVTGLLKQINATAAAALADVVTAGRAVIVKSSVVSVAVDGTYVKVDGASNLVTVAAGSLDSTVFAVGGIDASLLGADVTAAIPTAGAGLYQPSATSGALSVDVDNSSLVIADGALTIGDISAAQLSVGCIDFQHLSSPFSAFVSSLSESASKAYRVSVELSITQELVQDEMVSVLGLQQSEYEQLGLLSSAQLLAAIAHINDTAFAAVGQLNLSAFTLSTRLQTEGDELQVTLDAAVLQVEAALPMAGYGLVEEDGTLSVAVDSVYVGVVNGSVTVLAGSIDTAALADGAVTGSKLATGSVTASALAADSVRVDKLTTDLSSVLSILTAVDDSTLAIGDTTSSTTLTRPAGGDLLVQAAVGGDVSLLASSVNIVTLNNDDSASITTAGLNVAAQDVSLSAATVRSSSAELSLSAASSSILLANSSTYTTTGTSGLTAASVSLLASTSATISAARITSTVRAVPSVVVLTPLSLPIQHISIGFTSLVTSFVRLTGAVSSPTLNVTLVGCSAATAGLSLTVVNQLTTETALVVPAASCSRSNDLILPYPATVAVTCAGTQWDCTQTERPQGGLALPSSTQTILSNTDTGVVSTTTPVGVVQLSFTPVNNNSPFLYFTVTSPLLVNRPSAALLLTALSSGTTNEDYGTTGRETPVWICGGQVVDTTSGSVQVTMINVGDPLYTLEVQTVAFVYSII